MSANPDSARGSNGRSPAMKAAVAVGVVIAFLALVGPRLLTTRPPSPTGPAATGPGQTAGPGTPAPTDDPWSALELPPYAPTAELVPSDVDRLGVAATTSFMLTSRTDVPAVELAKGLAISPPLDFTVEPGSDAGHAVIRPAAVLERGARYRWDLTAPDGAPAGSWLFTTRQPLRVAGTLPGDQAIGVPLNTGIEVTFDQDGASGVADHVSIEPAVRGRFEQHGRTWAFVPDQPLTPTTIYTLTVRAGVAVEGSTERLADDVVVRFETGSVGTIPPRLEFERPIVEVRPNTEPIVPARLDEEREEEGGAGGAPRQVVVDVYRLPSLEAAIGAAERLMGEVAWAVASPESIVPTAGLERVAQVTAEGVVWDYGTLLRVPARLPTGQYLLVVEQAGGPAQMILQVTNLAAYALVTTKSTVVWVNDLARGAGVSGASVALVGGRPLGTTDADGLLTAETPAGLDAPSTDEGPEPAADLLLVRGPGGNAILLPLGMRSHWAYDSVPFGYGGSHSEHWTLFRTDRYAYRQTDTIHVSGLLLRRADRTAPSGVSLRLLAQDVEYGDGAAAVPITTVPVTLSARGSFIADVPLADLPRSQYRLELLVGGKTVASAYITVTDIRKPAFEISVLTDRQAYVAGDRVRVTATATFYDGTPVAGLELELDGFGDRAAATTDAAGVATASLVAGFADEVPNGWTSESVGAHPVRPEEGEVSGDAGVLVFPARLWFGGTARLDGDRIVVGGRLLAPDVDAFAETRDRDDWGGEPAGPAVEGGRVVVRVVHHAVTRTQIGTQYDFLEKKVVPLYEETPREVVIGTFAATSAADGSFRVAVDVPKPDDWYEVTVSAVDGDGRRLERTFDVVRPAGTVRDRLPYLLSSFSCGGAPSLTVGLGEAAVLTMHDGDGTPASGGRFLYVVSRQGTVEITVQDEPTFRRTLRDRDLPGFTVLGVWLSDGGFASSAALTQVDPADKRIEVRLEPDAPRYAPGEVVTIDVTTIGPDGRSIAADVVLEGIDQKMFTLGIAQDIHPLGDLLQPVGHGFVQSYSSHATPGSSGDGCGDAGGSRTEFMDVVTFQRITTDASGRGRATFRLSDDLTSWHVTATALSGGLDAGQASVLVPVGLPFFVEPVLAPDYLVGDRPILRLRAYGSGIASGDGVSYHVTSETLGVDVTVAGSAFEAVRVELPGLPLGDHDLRIEARATHAGTPLRDVLVRRIHVIPSRLTSLVRSIDALEPGYRASGGDGFTTFVITDAGRGSLIALLEDLATASSARYDRAAAADAARRLLIDEFGMDPRSLPPASFDPSRYEQGGITLLPYSSQDLALTALAAHAVPAALNREEVLGFLLSDGDELNARTRESRLIALAGAAGLGADVVSRLREHDAATLTIRERLWLALGLAAAGDHPAARAIERDLLLRHGQRLGPWVRLTAGGTLEDSLEASALLLVLAAELGDPLATDVAAYLRDNRSKERAVSLELLAYAERALAWLPRSPGRFAYSVGDERHEVALAPGGSFTLTLTAPQRASLRLEPLEGRLVVVTSWASDEPALPADPAITVRRTVTPANDAPETGLVRVRIEVSFGPKVPAGCYQLTDVLPSGLTPVSAEGVGDDNDDVDVAGGWPWAVDGQRVSWCVDPSGKQRTFGYAARVVSPGTYRWEPTVIQSLVAPELGAATEETTFTIR